MVCMFLHGLYLGSHLRAHNIQLFASFHLEEVQEIGDSAEQDAATDTDGLGKLMLLLLQQQGTSVQEYR